MQPCASTEVIKPVDAAGVLILPRTARLRHLQHQAGAALLMIKTHGQRGHPQRGWQSSSKRLCLRTAMAFNRNNWPAVARRHNVPLDLALEIIVEGRNNPVRVSGG